MLQKFRDFFGFLAKTTKNSEFVLLALKASEASMKKSGKILLTTGHGGCDKF